MRRLGTTGCILIAALFAGCATTSSPPTYICTPRNKVACAYQAYEACWRAAGPPTPGFFAWTEGGDLYAVMNVMSEAVVKCLASKGVTPIWGFSPSMTGGVTR